MNQREISVNNACPECHGKALYWYMSVTNNGSAVDGRLRLNEVSPIMVQACEFCSETIQVISDGEEVSRLLDSTPEEPLTEKEDLLKAIRTLAKILDIARGAPKTHNMMAIEQLASDVLVNAMHQPTAPGHTGAWRSASDGEDWPVIGERYLICIGPDLTFQHDFYEFDQGDDGMGGGEYFWSRDDVDGCPAFDAERDLWISVKDIVSLINTNSIMKTEKEHNQ